VAKRQGRNRLTKDLLRELLRELYKQRFRDDPEPDKRAEYAVTQREVAQWLQTQGAIAAGTELSPQDKTMAINGNLVAKLGELGLMESISRSVLSRVTGALFKIFKVVTEPDADVLHQLLRDRVLSYVRTELEMGDMQDAIVAEAETGISKALMMLRIGEIDPEKAMSLIVFHFGWLACASGVDMTVLRRKLLEIDEKLWELISPYVDDSQPSPQPASL